MNIVYLGCVACGRHAAAGCQRRNAAKFVVDWTDIAASGSCVRLRAPATDTKLARALGDNSLAVFQPPRTQEGEHNAEHAS